MRENDGPTRKEHLLPNIEGVLVTMMDKRPNFTRELVSQLREAYGGTIKVAGAKTRDLVGAESGDSGP